MTESPKKRVWRIVRGVFSAIALASILAVSVFGGYLYLTGSEAPDWLVNDGLAQRLSGGFGARHTIDSFRIGRDDGWCSLRVGLAGALVEIGGPENPVQINLDHVDWQGGNLAVAGLRVEIPGDEQATAVAISEARLGGGAFEAKGLRVGSQEPPAGLSIDEVRVAPHTSGASLQGLALTPEAGSSGTRVSVAEIGVSPVREEGAGGELIVDQVTVRNVSFDSPYREQGRPICERLTEVFDPLESVRTRGNGALERLESGLTRGRAVARWALIGSIVVFFLLKLLFSGGARKWWLRLALAGATVALPSLVYSLTPGNARSGSLLCVGLAAAVAMAAVLFFAVYRRFEPWYHKWEPAAVDIAAMSILLLFVANGFIRGLSFQMPSGVRIERTSVEGISGEVETAACDGLNRVRINDSLLEIAGVHLPISQFLQGKPAVAVSRIGFRGAGSEEGPTVTVANPSGREVLELSSLSAEIMDVETLIDLDQRRFENIGARLRTSGAAASGLLREGVGRINFLRESAGELSAARFAVTANAAGPRSEPPDLGGDRDADVDGVHFAADAGVGLDLVGCELPIDANLNVNTRGLKAAASIQRRGETIDARDIRSSDGSRVTFRGGTLRATLGDRVAASGALRDIGAKLEASEFSVGNAGFDFAAPAGCSPSGTQTLKAVLAGIGMNMADGLSAGLERASINFDRRIGRAEGAIGAGVELHDARLAGTSQRDEGDGQGGPWLSGDFPYAKLTLAGAASGETVPRRLKGTVDVLIARTATDSRQPGNLAFGIDKPVQFSADLWKREIDVSKQHRAFLQSIDPRLPESIALDFSFHAAAADDGGPANIRAHVLSDWISLSPLSFPRHFELSEISNLTLTTRGTLDRLPLDEDLIRFDDLPPLCRESVSLELNPFRVDANWPGAGASPLIRVHGKTDSEIRIHLGRESTVTEIGNSGLAIRTGAFERQTRKLLFPNARIEAIDLRLGVQDIRPNDGGGDALALVADVSRTTESFALASRIAGANAQPLLDVGFNRAGDRTEFKLLRELDVNRLVSAFKPFVAPLHCDFSWFTPDVRVQKLSGEAVLVGGTISSSDLNVTVAPGSRFAMNLDRASSSDSGKPPAHLRQVEFSVDPDTALALTVNARSGAGSDGRLDLSISGSVPLKIDARGGNGEKHEASLEIGAAAAGSLLREEPAANAVFERGRAVARDLRNHITNARRVFGNPQSGADRQTFDLKWDTILRNAPEKKFFEIRPDVSGAGLDELRSSLAIDRASATWKTATDETEEHFETSGALAAASKIHQDHLVIEADSSLAINVPLESQPGCQFNFQAPVAAAFRDRLEPAPAGPGSLWDAAFYESFWTGYDYAFPGRAFDPLVNCRSVNTGGISLSQVSLPATALRIAVGHGDRLQVNMPFAGRLLFGAAEGLLQAEAEWLPDRAVLTAGGNFSLSNFQAGALRRAAMPGYIPFVEDEFSTSASFLARGIPVGRDGVIAADRGAFVPAEFHPFDLDLKLWRARPESLAPGVLQATSRMNLKLMNEFLSKALAGVRLSEPPTALRYQGLDLNLAVKDGIIQTEPLFLNLRGVRLYASDAVEVESDIRVHWKRDGWTLPEYKFADLLASMRRFAGAETGE